jgi:hypothetical protein
MDQLIVTHIGGTTVKLNSKENGSMIKSAVQTVERLGQDIVDISVESATQLTFVIGDKITVYGRDYTLNQSARESKTAESRFKYDLHFEGVQYDLLRVAYNVNVSTTNNQIQDLSGNALTGDLRRFLDVLIANANRIFPGKWVLGTYPENTKTLNEVFSDTDNCLAVLQSLCSADKYNTEFNITIDANGVRTLNVGSFGNNFPYTFKYGRGRGLYELTREKVSESNIVTRLYVYGGSKNVPTTRYRSSELCLPDKSKAQSYIEDSAAILKYGIWEATKVFEDIYPGSTGTVTDYDPGAPYDFYDSAMSFDINGSENDVPFLLPGITAKIHFNTGKLAGYEFEISAYNHTLKRFTIMPIEDKNGYSFPSKTNSEFQPAIGDIYALIDIGMPTSFMTAAETELQTAGTNYLNTNSKPLVQYGLAIDEMFLLSLIGDEAETNVFWLGDYIPVFDADLGIDNTVRIKSFTRDLLSDMMYNLTISDIPVKAERAAQIISSINNIDKIVKFNYLNDPARARRNYLAIQEALNMIFDTEGDFFTEKIKPRFLSVQNHVYLR